MKAAPVYCTFRDGWYWHAQCSVDGLAPYESQSRLHGSARQAADEVLGYIKLDYPGATLRRRAPKVYEIAFPAQGARG